MRGTILTASLAVLVGVSSVGCKSMPSLTWWKTANNSNADATAVARSAPALPSDVAIQTEGLATNVVTTTGGSAAPYASTAAPAVSPTGYPNTQYPNTRYPNTGAPSYSSTVASSRVATQAMNNSNLGTIDMPYNPKAVPPATTVAPAATVAAAPPTADRYATTATPFSANATTNTLSNSAPLFSDAGSRYATPTASSTTPAYNTAPAASLAPSYAPATAQTTAPPVNNFGATLASATGAVGNRYAKPATTTSAPGAQASTATGNFPTNQKQTTQTLATSGPYRPGGTTTYPDAAVEPPSYEMASRPEASASATGTDSSVPNVATPGYTPTQAPSAPQVPRYW